MAKINRWKPNPEVDETYPYYCRRTEDGEILYSVPLEAPNKIPMDESEENAVKIEYSKLPLLGGRNLDVYVWETTDREEGFRQRAWLNSEHTRDRRRTKRETCVAETNDELDGSVWDSIQEAAYEQRGWPEVEKQALDRIEIQAIREIVKNTNPRYWEVFYQVRLYGEDAKSVADRMGISVQRVHQLADKVREIAEKYRKDNH